MSSILFDLEAYAQAYLWVLMNMSTIIESSIDNSPFEGKEDWSINELMLYKNALWSAIEVILPISVLDLSIIAY